MKDLIRKSIFVFFTLFFCSSISFAEPVMRVDSCIDLEKTGPETAMSGDVVTYNFKVTNCGELTILDGFEVYDPLFGSDPIRSGILDPGEIDEFDMTYQVTDDDCGKFVNDAWAIGTPVIPGISYSPELPDVRDDAFWMMYVTCEEEKASLGDFVWLDLNSNGIQESGEAGIGGVVVNLYDCNDNSISSTSTDAGGKYLFDNLVPGDYYVEFEKSSGNIFSPQNTGADNVDSDAAEDTGKTICTTLSAGENDMTWDAGLVPEPCTLTVSKLCYVPSPPPSDDTFDCKKPINSLTMIWAGSQNIRINAWKGKVGSTLLADIDNIIPDQAVTVSDYAGSPNDVYWEIFEAGTSTKIGESKFHLSCSDDEMDGAEDCGNNEGDGKGNDAGLINDWILAGMVDSQSDFNCFSTGSSSGANHASICEVTIPPQAECDGKLKTLVLKYIGGDCSKTSNWQEDKFKCDGDAGLNEPVQIVITKDAGKVTVIPDDESIMIGDEITIIADKELKAETKFDIVRGGIVLQSLNIHTSCSKPLGLGDRFGSVEVNAMDIKDGDYLTTEIEVEYTYEIVNEGVVPVENITVVDDILGVIPGSPIDLLQPGESVTLEASGLIKETTTNFVNVDGVTAEGEECSAMDSSTVTVVVPEAECIISGDSSLNFGKGDEDNKIEWELHNIGSSNITIDTISLSWPAEFGKLKKIKLGHDTIFEPDDVDRPSPPSVTINDWTGDVNKRQIKGDGKDKLKFEFEIKAPTSQYNFTTMVNSLEGCSVNYVPGAAPFDCKKPIDALTMIWDGSQDIRIKAWKGNIGSTLLTDIDNISSGMEVTVSGYAGSPNDVYWEIFEAGTNARIGESKFHLSCSDNEMKDHDDCGNYEGNGKGNDTGLINDWLLEGMVDKISSLDCTN